MLGGNSGALAPGVVDHSDAVPPVAVAGADDGSARGGKPVLVMRKARQILDSFDADRPEQTANEVQRRTGLPPSTCLRLLHTLVREGFLDRRGDHYRPGLALVRWAQAATAGLGLVSMAMPVLTSLRDATGESAYLYLRDGLQHTCIAFVQTAHPVVSILRIGQVLPLHAGSAGRVFLAFEPGLLEQLAEGPLPAYTPHTLTDPSRLRDAVAETRRLGYAATFEERAAGAASLSAPVREGSGVLVAALGIVSPVQRFPRQRVAVDAPHVLDAGAELSRRLGRA